MRIYYTGSDIEDLAASGIRQLEVGPGVALTDAARERAEELGIALLAPGDQAATLREAAAPAAATALARGASLPAKPRGCQHGPLGGTAASAGRQSPMVDQLVGAVSALKKRGG